MGQKEILSIFKDIINIELKNVVEIENMNDKKEKRYAESTSTLHIAAVNALREMVEEKWKVQRVDVDVLNFIKLAIEAVTVNENLRPSTHVQTLYASLTTLHSVRYPWLERVR